jgi:ethanolamine ammonia-lyase large subunit
MGKANEPKSGDELAGLAATSIAERVAAKYVLAEVTLETLRANPAVPYDKDDVTRVIDDAVNETIYDEIKAGRSAISGSGCSRTPPRGT